ncbi:MAG: IS200/IS605 family transposase [Nostoc sp.]|nr:IS200/IS605 family transposase [Nostoc sp. 'Peltigera membranacea cyanobiont' 232]
MILASIGRSVSDLKVHLVLVTKYRRKAFTSVMLSRLNTVMQELLEKWDCKLVEFSGEDDRVHLLFQYHPDVELSKLVNNLKSVSSRKLRQEFTEHLESFYWKDVFWSGSYFVASCGGVTVSTLRKYIEAQELPAEST